MFLTLTSVRKQPNRTAMIAASMEPITKCYGIKREDKRGENDAPAREVGIDKVLLQTLKSVCMNLQHFLNLYHFLLLFNQGFIGMELVFTLILTPCSYQDMAAVPHILNLFHE